MRRFWREATAAPTEAGWKVLLDARPVRLPGGAPLALPTAPLAAAVVAEWQAAGAASGEFTYADLPLTRIAGTAQERILPDPTPIAIELARWGESDLLCYRAERPEALAARQHAAWQPLLNWAEAELGARLTVTAGVIHTPQDPAALSALAATVAAESGWRLAALGVLVPGLGSLVLGLALARERLSVTEALGLATLDETFQEEIWGVDAEAQSRRARLDASLAEAARFLALAR